MTNTMDLFTFWGSFPPDATIHPQDEVFFKSNIKHDFKTSHRPPGPWDGPLMKAKVVICYANPKYDPDDAGRRELITRQMSGREDLPDCWDDWYTPRINAILPISKLRDVVAIFNICPYSSENMDDKEVRLAAGLPSVWAAQKHLREVLIPRAISGEIFLVVARKHQLWGVIEGCETKTFKLTRNRGGYFPSLGPEIENWLREKHGIQR